MAATGFVFQYFLGVNFVVGAVAGSLIIVLYTGFGGIRSVTFTDVFQFCILIVIVPVIANVGIIEMGGYQNIFDGLTWKGTKALNKDIIPYLSAMFFLEYMPKADPAIMQRFLMSRDMASTRRSLSITALLQCPFYIFIFFISIIAYKLNGDLTPNLAMPYVIDILIPTGLKGFAAAGLMAIIMSTADSNLNVASVFVTSDIIKPLLKREISEQKLLRIAKIMSYSIGCASIALSIIFEDILNIALYFANFWAPVVIIPIFASVFGYRTSGKVFLWSVGAGIGGFLVWDTLFIDKCPYLPSFIAGMVCNLVIFCFFYRKVGYKENTLRMKERPMVSARRDIFSILKALKGYLFPEQLSWAPAISFGAFALIVYNLPSVMWDTGTHQALSELLFLKIISSFLCAGLLLKNYWPQALVRYFPIYWHMTLMFTLPFLLTLYGLASGFSDFSLVNITLGLFLLGLLTSWQAYLMLFALGSGLAVFTYMGLCASTCFAFSGNTPFVLLFCIGFSSIMGILFSRQKQDIDRVKMSGYRALAAQIAHELRTPLQAVHMDCDILKIDLQKGDLTQLQQHVEKLSQKVDTLSQSAELILGTLRGDRAHMDMQSYKMTALLEESIWGYPDPRARLQQKVTLDSENVKNVFVHVDRLMLSHVVQNIMKNAFEAMHNLKNPRLVITAFVKEGHVQVCFANQGGGIPSHQMHQIFDPFVTTKVGGTGVGLPFCKKAMDLMKGHIHCKSEENKGTVFTLDLPMTIGDEEASS
ncbi:ATP-binding protein [Alphaproteobacteria bacterium]|nr:ATP-binding protein [Alphaproteobacteria bacterium]